MTTVRITFWGEIADRLGQERSLDMPSGEVTVGAIRAELARQDEAAQTLLRAQIRAAVDAVVCSDDTVVGAGQEVAFFSVVSGG